MTRSLRRLLGSVSLLLASSLTAQDHAAARDFDAHVNPNGVWSYGWSTSRGAAFQLDPVSFTSCVQSSGWTTYGGNPTVIRNFDTTTTCCATWSLPPGRILMHPGGSGENAVVRWTAPASGMYLVSAEWFGIDRNGTTSDAAVLVRGLEAFSHDVTGFHCGTPCLSTVCGGGVSWQGAVYCSVGDPIDFTVGYGPNQNYGSDATAFDATLQPLFVPTTLVLGPGCGAAPQIPTLLATTPHLGTPFSLTLANAPATTPGAIYGSLLPPSPLALPFGCTVWLDLRGFVPLFDPIATDAAGAWSTPVLLPADPSLAGLVITAQALLAPTAGPFGASLSNGLQVTLGF